MSLKNTELYIELTSQQKLHMFLLILFPSKHISLDDINNLWTNVKSENLTNFASHLSKIVDIRYWEASPTVNLMIPAIKTETLLRIIMSVTPSNSGPCLHVTICADMPES